MRRRLQQLEHVEGVRGLHRQKVLPDGLDGYGRHDARQLLQDPLGVNEPVEAGRPQHV